MKTSMQYLLDEIRNIKNMMNNDDGSMTRTYVSVIESHAMYLMDLNKKEIADAWLDGQGNIPQHSEWSSEDYSDANDYIKHTYPTL